MPPGVGLPDSLDLRFSAAEKYFAGKVSFTREEFDAMRADAQLYAFTVARVTSMQLIDNIRDAVQRAIIDGTTLADFQKVFPQLMTDFGWSGLTPWHIETIFRTNTQMAYGMGQRDALLKVTDALPYWKYSAIHDARVRPSHLALDGRIYPADHEFWRTHFPPWDYN